MKNKKAFTLTELIAVITILGLLLLIAVPSIGSLLGGFRKDYYKKLENSVTEAGKNFYLENKIYRPTTEEKTSYVNIETLISKKYISEVIDYKKKKCDTGEKISYVLVTNKGNGKYEYTTCLKCSGDNYTSKNNLCN